MLLRTGKPPKRAIPFQTSTPFNKLVVNLIAPNGGTQKIEFLGNGQQMVAAGVHPETGKPYRWHGGDLCNTRRDELPYIHEATRARWSRTLRALEREHRLSSAKPAGRASNGGSRCRCSDGAEDWPHLIENIRKGQRCMTACATWPPN